MSSRSEGGGGGGGAGGGGVDGGGGEGGGGSGTVKWMLTYSQEALSALASITRTTKCEYLNIMPSFEKSCCIYTTQYIYISDGVESYYRLTIGQITRIGQTPNSDRTLQVRKHLVKYG